MRLQYTNHYQPAYQLRKWYCMWAYGIPGNGSGMDSGKGN